MQIIRKKSRAAKIAAVATVFHQACVEADYLSGIPCTATLLTDVHTDLGNFLQFRGEGQAPYEIAAWCTIWSISCVVTPTLKEEKK